LSDYRFERVRGKVFDRAGFIECGGLGVEFDREVSNRNRNKKGVLG